MTQYKFHIVFEPTDDGRYSVFVPALSGCFTWGKTLKEARARAKEAIHCHISGLLKDGEPIPVEPGTPEFRMEKLTVEFESLEEELSLK